MARKKIEKVEEEVIGGGSVTNLMNILLRIVAVFAAEGLSIVGAGSIIGISTAAAVGLAGFLGVATVVEALARAFLNDGKLDADEINAAFSNVDKKSRT